MRVYEVPHECDRSFSNYALLRQHSSCKLNFRWSAYRSSTNRSILPNHANIKVIRQIPTNALDIKVKKITNIYIGRDAY